MDMDTTAGAASPLKLLPAYTGVATLEEALGDPRGLRLLWIEILVNDRLDLSPWSERADVREGYTKACRWYTAYRSLINSLISRTPLPSDHGPLDPRDYRVFAEALRFAADHR